MALVISDLHGNHKKTKTFLEYKPDETHIIAGDILDSVISEDKTIIETFNMCIKSSAILLWGNHELSYLKNPPFYVSGKRNLYEFKQLIEYNQKRFYASIIDNGYLITHAGVHKRFGKEYSNIEDISRDINLKMEDYLNNQKKYSILFDICIVRGGDNAQGGIFWCDFKREEVSAKFNQIYGHTHTWELTKKINYTDNTKHVAVDMPFFFCYNTKTHDFEDFMPEMWKDNRREIELCY